MKVFLGIIGSLSLIASAVFGMDGYSLYEQAKVVTHQSIAVGLITISCLFLLISCVCFSACIRTTPKDTEELRLTVIKHLSELRNELSKK